MTNKLIIGVLLLLFSCNDAPDSQLKVEDEIENNTTDENRFIISTWTNAKDVFDATEWNETLNNYKELGISEVLVQGSPEVLEQIVAVANEKDIKIHGWMWTLNRPGDTIANKHPEWYAVNRKGQNSLEYNAYVGYYQWLSPFHPEARAHIKNNVQKLLEIEGLASVHLDYVRYPDVILGAALQPKYGIVQETEMPEYDYDYHPLAREGFKQIFERDPLDMSHPELSPEWRQYRLNAVSSLVNEIAEMVHAKGQNLTAAVFPFPEMSRQMVRQAWNDWNLDRAYPMLYHNFYNENINWIGFAAEEGIKSVDFAIMPGLYMPAFEKGSDLAKAIELCREKGAAGVSLFTANNLSPDLSQSLINITSSPKHEQD